VIFFDLTHFFARQLAEQVTIEGSPCVWKYHIRLSMRSKHSTDIIKTQIRENFAGIIEAPRQTVDDAAPVVARFDLETAASSFEALRAFNVYTVAASADAILYTLKARCPSIVSAAQQQRPSATQHYIEQNSGSLDASDTGVASPLSRSGMSPAVARIALISLCRRLIIGARHPFSKR
jgi:hypothetical protein